MREWLERDIRKEEVREVVNSCKQDKTPRDLMVSFWLSSNSTGTRLHKR